MNTIHDNEIRIGNFTSSQIFRLCGAGKRDMTPDELAARPKTGKGSAVKTIEAFDILSDTALEYIAEKNVERKIGRSINVTKQSRSALWGSYLEQRVHDMLPTSYRLIGKKTESHPTIPNWCGSPDNDCKAESLIGDIKCYEPKKFVEYVDCLSENDIHLYKQNFPQEYWQLVSNACIFDMDNMEAIVYCPYFSELPDIRQSVMDIEDEDLKRKYSFIAYSSYNELAWIADGCAYKNINRFRFVVPKEDKEFLSERVKMAIKFLIKPIQE
jgi:hypothetical protein